VLHDGDSVRTALRGTGAKDLSDPPHFQCSPIDEKGPGSKAKEVSPPLIQARRFLRATGFQLSLKKRAALGKAKFLYIDVESHDYVAKPLRGATADSRENPS